MTFRPLIQKRPHDVIAREIHRKARRFDPADVRDLEFRWKQLIRRPGTDMVHHGFVRVPELRRSRKAVRDEQGNRELHALSPSMALWSACFFFISSQCRCISSFDCGIVIPRIGISGDSFIGVTIGCVLSYPVNSPTMSGGETGAFVRGFPFGHPFRATRATGFAGASTITFGSDGPCSSIVISGGKFQPACSVRLT